MGAVASCSNRQPSRNLIGSRSGLLLLLRLLGRRPAFEALLDTRRRQLLDGERLRHPAHRLRQHRSSLVLPHRTEVLDRDQPRDRLVTAAEELSGRIDLAEPLAAHLHLQLGLAAALVGAAQHRNVGVVASHAHLDVLSRAQCSERRVDAEPAVGRDVRLRPRVRGLRQLDAAEVAAHVASGEARVAAQRDQDVREVLADARSAREHLGDGAVHGRRADAVLEASAHVVGGAAEEGERRCLRVFGEERLGERGRLVREHDIGARAEELGQFVCQRLVPAQCPEHGRRVRLTLRRPGQRLVGARVRHDVARRLDHEPVVQVRHAEVVDCVAVVVPERDHGRRRLDQQVEVEQGLSHAGERLQTHLVEALEDVARVAIARPVEDPVPHAMASCAVRGRWAKNSSSTRSPMR